MHSVTHSLTRSLSACVQVKVLQREQALFDQQREISAVEGAKKNKELETRGQKVLSLEKALQSQVARADTERFKLQKKCVRACVCVSVRACGRVYVRACVHVCVRACELGCVVLSELVVVPTIHWYNAVRAFTAVQRVSHLFARGVWLSLVSVTTCLCVCVCVRARACVGV